MGKEILKEYYKNRIGINIEELQTLKDQINTFHMKKSYRNHIRASALKISFCNFCLAVFI